MKFSPLLNIAFAGLAVAGLTACGGSDSDGAGTGTASFDATDAPVDGVTTVKVTFSGIALKPSDGPIRKIEFDEPVTIENLLDLTGNASEPILGDTTLAAGQYNFVRLFVIGGDGDNDGTMESMVVEDTGGEFPLFIPGQQPQAQNNNQRFLQLVTPFVVPAGGNADFTIDFELRKALTKPDGQNHYLLRPALRLINNVEVGTVAGTVDGTLVNDTSCTNDVAADEGHSVYLYAGSDADVGDVYVDVNGDSLHGSDDPDADGVSPEVNPLTAADVKLNSETAEYEYTIGFVAEGDYTIAFTCQSLDDTPDADEGIVFEGAANISVAAGEVTTHDFSASP